MSTLHLISKSPFAHSALDDYLRACGERATLVLIEDAVNAALRDSTWAMRLQQAGHTVFVLDADCAARGLTAKIEPAFTRIDYARFVQLCCEHAPLVSWY